jgi:transposase-like protein
MSKRKPIPSLSASEQEILALLQSGKGLQEALAPMVKRVMEAALEGELAAHLESEENSPGNRRNGHTKKRIKSSSGAFDLITPRDRDGSFEPQLVKKRQTVLTDDLDQKILNLYANGMSYSDIRSNLEEIYQVEISSAAITQITDRLLPEVDEWRHRPLESVYPLLYLDAVHFKVREEGKVVPKAIYSLLGVTSEGKKDILGLYINDTEGAHFWAGVLASLKERGVKDILIACVDGLTGFQEAIHSLFPKTEVQLCIIHQIRNSMRYIATKDQKVFMSDLKRIYQATSKEQAEYALSELDEKWGKKYPVVLRSWQNNWDALSNFFKYDNHIRKIIYTTNAVEGLHRMIRKYTKTKAAFTSENALLKLVYCAYQKILLKWTMPVANWAIIVSQLNCHFNGRIKLNIA